MQISQSCRGGDSNGWGWKKGRRQRLNHCNGSARIARIKPGAILVNTARGALVDEAALIDALASGRIGRAGLDVFHAEPLKADHPLAQLDNVTLSPHAAFRTPEASENLLRRALDIVRKVQGYPPSQ